MNRPLTWNWSKGPFPSPDGYLGAWCDARAPCVCHIASCVCHVSMISMAIVASVLDCCQTVLQCVVVLCRWRGRLPSLSAHPWPMADPSSTHQNEERGQQMLQRVGARFRDQEKFLAFQSWRENLLQDINNQRAQIILKRVGGRWRNEELWGAYRNWKMKWREDADRERGEMIMRRVGARMMNKELAMTWDAWHRNCKEGLLQMVSGGMGAWM